MTRGSSTICVTELLINFNKTIACLANNATKINLEWREENAYDEWDEVAQVVFDAFVKFPIEWGIYQNQKTTIALPDYDVMYADYSKFSYFVCTPKESCEDQYIFHSFKTKNLLMDTVRALRIDVNEKICDNNFYEIPIEEAKFILYFKEAGSILKKINEVTI